MMSREKHSEPESLFVTVHAYPCFLLIKWHFSYISLITYKSLKSPGGNSFLSFPDINDKMRMRHVLRESQNSVPDALKNH